MSVGVVRLASGVYIPNANLQYNSTGRTGLPDGWTPSAQWTTDLGGTPKLTQAWEPLQFGLGTLVSQAPPFGDDVALQVGILSTATSDATRAITSPYSRDGQMFGAEQMTNGDYWKYTLSFWFNGLAAYGTPASDDFSVLLIARDNTSGREKTVLTANIAAASYTGAWVYLSAVSSALGTSGWSGAGSTNPTHVYLKMIAKHNSQGSGTLYGSFARFAVSTLGPLETPGATGFVAGATNYWQLSRPFQLQGTSPASYDDAALLGRTAALQGRLSDPGGGAQKRTWPLHLANATETDREMLYRAKRLNHGFPSAPSSAFGQPRPLALTWNAPEEFDASGNPATHLVDLAALTIDYYKPVGWIAPTRAAQRYDITVTFREV